MTLPATAISMRTAKHMVVDPVVLQLRRTVQKRHKMRRTEVARLTEYHEETWRLVCR